MFIRIKFEGISFLHTKAILAFLERMDIVLEDLRTQDYFQERIGQETSKPNAPVVELSTIFASSSRSTVSTNASFVSRASSTSEQIFATAEIAILPACTRQ